MAADQRLEDMRVAQGEGQADSMATAVDWLLGLLSDGDRAGYVTSVLERAEAMHKGTRTAQGAKKRVAAGRAAAAD
jgi:hypothetical protein